MLPDGYVPSNDQEQGTNTLSAQAYDVRTRGACFERCLHDLWAKGGYTCSEVIPHQKTFNTATGIQLAHPVTLASPIAGSKISIALYFFNYPACSVLTKIYQNDPQESFQLFDVMHGQIGNGMLLPTESLYFYPAFSKSRFAKPALPSRPLSTLQPCYPPFEIIQHI